MASRVLLIVLLAALSALLVAAQTSCPHKQPSKNNPIGCILKIVNISSSIQQPNNVAYDAVHKKILITDSLYGQIGVFTVSGKFIKYLDTSVVQGFADLYTAGVDVHGYVYVLSPSYVELLVFSPGPAYKYLNTIAIPYNYLGLTAGIARVHASKPYLFMSHSGDANVLVAYKLSYHPNDKHATRVTAVPAGATDQSLDYDNYYLSVAIDPANGQVGIIGEENLGGNNAQIIQFYTVDYSDPHNLVFTEARYLNGSNSAISQIETAAYNYGYDAVSTNFNIDPHGRIVVSLFSGYTSMDYLIFMNANGESLSGSTPVNTGAEVDGFLLQPAMSPSGSYMWVPSEAAGELVFVQGFH